MTSQEIQRTEYLVPGSGLPRLGSTTHAESAVDVAGYLRPLEQVHGSALHGSGVAEGLAVTAVPGSASVQIGPGVAVDTAGRHISLAAGGTAEISADPANSSQLVPVTADGVTLPTTGHTGDCVVTVAWRETFDQALFASSGQKIFQDNHTPWLLVSPAPATPADGGQVVLAAVSLDANGNVLPGGLTAGGRHGPAPAVEAIQLQAASQSTAETTLSVTAAASGTLRARPGGGLQLQVTNPASQVEISAGQGNVSQLSVGADRVVLRRADGAEAIVLDTTDPPVVVGPAGRRSPVGIRGSGTDEELLSLENHAGQTTWHINQNPGGSNPGLNIAETGVADGRLFVQPGGNLGVNTTAPASPLHVSGNRGIQQNNLYISGGPGWSSISYNAHHDEGNGAWVFPDPSRPAVTVEMDDAAGVPRFQVWTTTAGNTTGWILRFAIDGNTGLISCPGDVSVSGHISASSISASRDSTDYTLAASNVSGTALCATSTNGTAIGAASSNGNALTTFGPSSLLGNVDVHGTLTANTKDFLIDHPVDPENKLLKHTSIESPERTNIYSGSVVLDAAGEARVQLPEWIEALNKDFRYQLTCIGRPAQVYVAQEVSEAVFIIAGGEPGMKVCWQVTGIRNDAWAQAHPFQAEEEKPDAEKGHYLHPRLFGHDLAKSVHWQRHQDTVKRNRALHKGIIQAEGDEGEYAGRVQSILG